MRIDYNAKYCIISDSRQFKLCIKKKDKNKKEVLEGRTYHTTLLNSLKSLRNILILEKASVAKLIKIIEEIKKVDDNFFKRLNKLDLSSLEREKILDDREGGLNG